MDCHPYFASVGCNVFDLGIITRHKMQALVTDKIPFGQILSNLRLHCQVYIHILACIGTAMWKRNYRQTKNNTRCQLSYSPWFHLKAEELNHSSYRSWYLTWKTCSTSHPLPLPEELKSRSRNEAVKNPLLITIYMQIICEKVKLLNYIQITCLFEK